MSVTGNDRGAFLAELLPAARQTQTPLLLLGTAHARRYDRSRTWRCPDCDVTSETCLAEGVAAPEMSSEDREALQELSFKGEKTKSRNASECATPAEEVASGGEGGPMEEATAGKAQAEATQAETAQAGGAATGDAPQPAARRAVPAQAAAPPATPRRPAETIQMQPAKVDWMFNCFVGGESLARRIGQQFPSSQAPVHAHREHTPSFPKDPSWLPVL